MGLQHRDGAGDSRVCATTETEERGAARSGAGLQFDISDRAGFVRWKRRGRRRGEQREWRRKRIDDDLFAHGYGEIGKFDKKYRDDEGDGAELGRRFRSTGEKNQILFAPKLDGGEGRKSTKVEKVPRVESFV